jgi:hypothetical protein
MAPIVEADAFKPSWRATITRMGDPVVKLLVAVLTALLFVPAAHAAAATRTFVPSGDSGTAHRLVVTRGSRAYVRFEVALPPGATVTSAQLRLYATALARPGTSVSRAGRTVASDRRQRLGWRTLRVDVAAPGPNRFVLSGRALTPSRYHSRRGAKPPRLVVTYTPVAPSSSTCPVPRPQTTWRAPGSPPLTDAQAAACVAPSGENRPQNAAQNAKAPTDAELAAFRSAEDAYGRTPAEYNPDFAHVTGGGARYGLRSTDDLIEWAAYKWGVPEDMVRGQMVMESGWSMLQKGDRRAWATPVASLYPAPAVIDADSVWESLGIAQIRWRHTVPWNPGVEPLRWQSTGFALDYSQALIRYYFDGYCDWCGGGYTAGDPDGAYRSYVSGSWTDGQWYADGVRRNAASRSWEPIPAA